MLLKVTVSPELIGGDVDEGYGKVADAFRANFASGGEVGAAMAVYRNGVKVVDLWGGYGNGITKTPWQHDTMVNMFSSTKGVAALAVAVAVSRGLFGYDDKVVDHWPEFGQAGKADVTVRQLLGHQAGLCVLKPAPSVRDVADPARLSAMLAAQKPAWPPGTRHGYHAVTLGWYESELIRRTDPAGRTLGRFFADEIAGPLGLDLYIGLPDSMARDRIAHLHHWSRAESLLHLAVLPGPLIAASFNPVGLLARAGSLPSDVDPWAGDYNRDDVRAIEIPSANGTGTAAAVARLYGAAAAGDAALGLTPGVRDSVYQPGLQDWNLSLFKSFVVNERTNLQFRAEAYDFPNHPNLCSTSTSGCSVGGFLNPTSSQFGMMTSKANLVRNLQLTLRLTF